MNTGPDLKGVVAKGKGEAGCTSLGSLGGKGKRLELVLGADDLHTIIPAFYLHPAQASSRHASFAAMTH